VFANVVGIQRWVVAVLSKFNAVRHASSMIKRSSFPVVSAEISGNGCRREYATITIIIARF